MKVSIRTAHGEAQFRNLAEVTQALQQGLVEPEDEVQLEGGTEWRKVSEVVRAPVSSAWKAHYHWYVLAATLLAASFVGMLAVIAVFSCHMLWFLFARPGKKARLRLW